MRLLLIPVVGLSLVGCGEAVFQCSSAEDCTGDRVGFCEPDGYCSFGDDDCPSGRRYGAYAGNGLAHMCTPEGDDGTGGMTTGVSDPASTSTGPNPSTSAPTEPDPDTTSPMTTMTSATTMSVDDSTTDASTSGVSSSGSGGESSSSTGLAGPFAMSFGDRSDADVQDVTDDSSVASWDVTYNLGAHGDLHIDGGEGDVEVGLLRIDVSALPAAAQVSDVELHMWNMDYVADGQVDLFVMSEYWLEGTADVAVGVCNWNDRDEGVPWTTPGAGAGCYVDDVLDTFFPDTEYTEHVLSIPADVIEAWRDSPGDNHGLQFRSPDLSGPVYIATREQAEEGYRPLLIVTYYE